MFGVGAAAVAFLTGAVITALAAAWWSERQFVTGFSTRVLVVFAAASFGLASASYWMFAGNLPLETSWLVAIALAAALLPICAFALLAGFSKSDRAILRKMAGDPIVNMVASLRKRDVIEGKSR
jgi:hypothetical protein